MKRVNAKDLFKHQFVHLARCLRNLLQQHEATVVASDASNVQTVADVNALIYNSIFIDDSDMLNFASVCDDDAEFARTCALSKLAELSRFVFAEAQIEDDDIIVFDADLEV